MKPGFGPRSRMAALLLAAVATLPGCGKNGDEPPKAAVPGAAIEGTSIAFPPDSPQLATIRVVEATPERESFVKINGRIGWDESRTSRVTVPVAGRIVEVKVAAGSRVTRGQVLAVVSSPEYGQTQAEARKSESELTMAERALARARELHSAGVLPLKDLQAAENDHASARAERSRTEARERLYGASPGIDQLYRITSPVAGVVVDRRINVGQEVRPDQDPETPLFLISDPARLWVLLEVPEALSREVSVGEPILITVPALPDDTFTAQVEYVADFIDPSSRMVRARAAVSNPDRKLKSAMYVNAQVAIPPSRALRVPAIGVFLLEDRHYAFVQTDPGRFERRQVQAEEASLGFMRVSAGLAPGDRVVADGALLLQQMLNQRASAPDKSKAGRQGTGNE